MTVFANNWATSYSLSIIANDSFTLSITRSITGSAGAYKIFPLKIKNRLEVYQRHPLILVPNEGFDLVPHESGQAVPLQSFEEVVALLRGLGVVDVLVELRF
jgi:hypothetical protein